MVRDTLGRDISAEQFQAMGYQLLSYHTNNNKDVFEPIFTARQVSNIEQQDDDFGHSDQVPFTLAGLPCATFEGNYTYYHDNPPPWSYPYDQPDDTIQLMNTFANGSSSKAQALALALSLPGVLTTWMLNQSDILGQAADDYPIATISDIGQTQVGQSISLDAKTSFDSSSNINALTYLWDFGDGTKAIGVTVEHTYKAAGNYTLMVIVNSRTGSRRISKLITVYTQRTSYVIPYSWYQSGGAYSPNYAVALPTLDDHLTDKVKAIPTPIPAPTLVTPTPTLTRLPVTPTPRTSTSLTRGTGASINFVWGAGILVILLGIAILVALSRRKNRCNVTTQVDLAVVVEKFRVLRII